MSSVKEWLNRHAADILTGLGVTGVVGTAAAAVHDTKKAQTAIRDKEQALMEWKREKLDDGTPVVSMTMPALTWKQRLRIAAPHYIWTVLSAGATIGCIFGARGFSRAAERRLIGTIASIEAARNGYRNTVKDILGEKTDEFIETQRKREIDDALNDLPPWDVKQTFYLDIPEYIKNPVFFEMTMYEVLKAEYEYNRLLALKGTTTINDLLACFGLPKEKGLDDIGHDQYIGEVNYGYYWVDFYHKQVHNDDDMLIWAIEMPFGPHQLEEEI